jgi:hypothetical protein
METFRQAVKITSELDNLLEASFGRPEAGKVIKMICRPGERGHQLVWDRPGGCQH